MPLSSQVAWTWRQRIATYPPTMRLEPGQLWKDVNGHARVCGVVPVEGIEYAVLIRTRGAGGRKRRPFLFPVDSLLAGDDGWHVVQESIAQSPNGQGRNEIGQPGALLP